MDFAKNKNHPDGLHFECKDCGRAYRAERRELINERNRLYRLNNKEKTKQYWKNRYNQNIEQELKRSADYRKKNPEKVKETQKRYYKNNLEKVAEYRKKQSAKPEYKIKQKEAVRACRKRKPQQYRAYAHKRRAKIKGNGGSYTAQQWIDLCNFYGNICLCCKRKLPLEVDHIIPVTKGGTSNIDNLQPLCKSCNSSKNNKIIDYRTNPRVEVEIREV
jgi:5-methylcytosine-specific restriction endonuclease McrA